MDGKIKKLKENPQDKYNKASERISSTIIDENAKQGKCHGKTTGHCCWSFWSHFKPSMEKISMYH